MEPSILCTSETYLIWRKGVIGLIVIIVSIIIGLGIFHFRHRHSLRRRNRFIRLEELDRLELTRLGIISEGYQDKFFFWEYIIMFRRTILLLIFVLLFNQSSWRLFLMEIFAMAFFVIHLLFQPYIVRRENYLELFSLGVLLFITLLQSSTSLDVWFDNRKFFYEVLLVVVLIIFGVYMVLIRLPRRLKTTLKITLKKIMKKYTYTNAELEEYDDAGSSKSLISVASSSDLTY